MSEVQRAKEHAAWTSKIVEVTVPERGSFRFGYFKDQPTVVYMFIGPAPYYYRVGAVPDKMVKGKPRPAGEKDVVAFCKRCQEIVDEMRDLDSSIKPKSEPEVIQWIRMLIEIKEGSG